jgi:hypothetical protein
MTKQYDLLINVTYASLNTKYTEENPTVEQIEQELTSFRSFFKVTDEEYDRAIKNLNSRLIHKISFATTLKGENSTHVPWYNKSKIKNFYWNRYNEYLRLHKHWSPEIVKRINETSDEIMTNLGNPKSENPFQRRGLVLGDVQSGKTANYTAVCNKAVDSGYKIIIVLAGMMENLRTQTQARLDAEFVGKTSKYLLDVKNTHILQNRNIGVGKIEGNKSNNQITCFTSVDTDFKRSTIKAVNLSINNLNGAALFVVKKNKSILTNLHNWLKSNNVNYRSGLIDLPALIIDDESDNASINTNSEEKDPTAINKAIRDILHLFKQASYIGITATPFANIFINVDDTDKVAEDLFPKDFITLLPTPEKYIGAEKIFGKADMDEWYDIDRAKYLGEYQDSLISIANEEQAPYFAYKHKKEIAKYLDDIPESLKTAIRYFILVCAISDFRKDEKAHRSMLVNVSRFTDVQDRTTDIISELIKDIKYSIESFSKLEVEKALQITEIFNLYTVWQEFNLEEKANTKWKNIQQNYLWSSTLKIQTIAVNQNNGSKALDYDKYKEEGKRVIAIGGNSLSRGITLEGLCVSYFYRNTMMYDTLLQMGRWFGYRPNYGDLFKIWMGEDSIDWYGYISDAVNELKSEIKIMNRQNQTPSDFGLKVRQAPCSLIVTARNKMRNGTPISRPISVSGRLIETPRLFSDKEILFNNTNSCLNFLKKIDKIVPQENSYLNKKPNAYIWKEVPKDEIVQLLHNFKSHPWNLNFQSSALAKYIEESSNGLENWDVGIPFGISNHKYELTLNDKTILIKPEQRSIKKDITIKNMIKISGRHVRVGAGGCSKIGLTEEQISHIKKLKNKQSLTDKDYLFEGRTPILLIHIIENKDYNAIDVPKYIFALSLGFPGGEEDKTAIYIVNTKELQNYIDSDIKEDIYDEDY